jgi:hypothetical protein
MERDPEWSEYGPSMPTWEPSVLEQESDSLNDAAWAERDRVNDEVWIQGETE